MAVFTFPELPFAFNGVVNISIHPSAGLQCASSGVYATAHACCRSKCRCQWETNDATSFTLCRKRGKLSNDPHPYGPLRRPRPSVGTLPLYLTFDKGTDTRDDNDFTRSFGVGRCALSSRVLECTAIMGQLHRWTFKRVHTDSKIVAPEDFYTALSSRLLVRQSYQS